MGEKRTRALCLGRTMQHASVVGVKMLVNTRRGRERGKRSVQHYRVRFSVVLPTVVFNALSPAAPPSTRPSSHPLAPHRS